jgi:hypothetical protein
MIVDIFLDILYQFLRGISLLVQNWGEVTPDNRITVSLVEFKNHYLSLNQYLPIDTILQVVAFVIFFEGLVFLYKMIRWGYQKIPGVT